MGAVVNRVELRNIAARDAAPMIGTYICDDFAAVTCPCRPRSNGGAHAGPNGHCYHESTRRRLAWQYGEARAASIMAGTDDASDRDERAWERLGGEA